jgi:hypothetical protein
LFVCRRGINFQSLTHPNSREEGSMTRIVSAGLIALLVAAAPPNTSHAPKPGTYELAMTPGSGIEQVYALVKLTPKDDGKIEAELVSPNPRIPKFEISGATLSAGVLQIHLKVADTPLTFECRVPKANAEKMLGSMGDDNRITPASLTATEKEKLEARDSMRRVPVPEPMQKAQQLMSKPLSLRLQAQRESDADKKKELMQESADAAKEAEIEVPKLYREMIEKHGADPAAGEAAMQLLRRAGKDKAPADEVKKLAEIVQKVAAPRGPRYELDAMVQLAEILAAEKGMATLALEFATSAEKSLDQKSTADQQVRVLAVLEAAQRKAGKVAEAEVTAGRLAKLETVLDQEYLAKMPPFKPEIYSGRKEKSDRVVVMELFTGAQCPPCVAADLGFDALEKTYKPTEVVLLQYHLHIPGPDPLTNPTTEARAKHYSVNSTPTTLFNGKKEAGGGGAVAGAKGKYNQYREILDKLLEEPAKAAIALDAQRQGDKITIRTKVSKLESPGDKVRLRVALVEEAIRYVGGNKLRFHHMVVRSMPGGEEGVKLTDKDSEHTATVELAKLRQNLSKYLDDAADKRPFPKPDRPMAMKHLKVIAFVQDDESGEILQAALADLGEEHAAK